ncbi:Argonaute/Dicer protein, PAZ [Artemisia annua]|uniref:Argonaute/Dicer protein, PAZ n=1 Tax=Artemisia annua TaxID=35608 RepID=A0A2U1LKP4_ARTAN|nr:Argonaute/Dicer protein, PAZ [Artemisia annua]
MIRQVNLPSGMGITHPSCQRLPAECPGLPDTTAFSGYPFEPSSFSVSSQFNAVRESTDLMVEYYHETTMGTKDGKKVMVMTPQILLDALRNAYIKFEMIWLLIIDECHRASGNHPYASIMKEFYPKAVKKPKVFGMTACTVTKQGVSSSKECEAQVTTLKSIQDSKAHTIQNRTDMKNVTPSPSHNYCFYQPAKVDHAELKVKLESLKLKFGVQLLEMQISMRSKYKDTNEKHEIFRTRLSNEYADIIYCIDELGLLFAYEALKILIANATKSVEECDIFQQSWSKCVCFLVEALSIVGKYLPDGHENVLDAGCDYENMVAAGYISPKLNQLFHLFQPFREATKVPCLIFVERVITTEVLAIIVKRVAVFSHLEVSSLSGDSTSVDVMAPKLKKKTLDLFRKVSLLFTTDVVDEGASMPKCSTLICFDIPKTAPRIVQSWEQARQSGCQFIIMLERGNAKQRQHVCNIIRSEQSTKKSTKKQNHNKRVVKPDNEDPSENISAKIAQERASGLGTKKRKELHGITPIRALSGTWGDKIDGSAQFYGYKVSFSCSIADMKFSSFVFMVESKLDDDVENIEMNLYMASNLVKCNVSSFVELHLNAEQISKAKCFQELCFNGIYGELYIGSKKLEEPMEFLLNTNQTLWTPSYMYLLLPLESLEPLRISWKEIDSCVSVVKFIKENSIFKAEKNSMDIVMMDSDGDDMVHFANKSLHKDEVKDVVVLAIHSGKIYFVIELLEDEIADSPFYGNAKNYSLFTDYFSKDYENNLKYPQQHLLVLKQSRRAQNVLLDFHDEGVLHGNVETDRQRYAHIPPELLVVIDVRIEAVKSFYLLPSLMHRIESLMFASQLREEIEGQSTDLHISNCLVLEAITTLRCNESFSMERLEMLGDSVLKFAVSCNLYLEYATTQEGQLSSRRSWQVCNSTLYNLRIARRLQAYIRDTAFVPTRWTAPGQLALQPFPCDHGIETIEVPVDPKYQTEDPTIHTGKCCDMGHRWLSSKTVSDCVESLVGAYFVGGGLAGALHCMKWLGMSCELDPSRVNEALEIASLHTNTPKHDVIQCLEKKLGYEFKRLEFLGDSVLDVLITWYLYSQHKDIEPGELTELRSASVNNENFASAAVRGNLYPHLQYRLDYLHTQIADYVKSVTTSSTDAKKGPKALGDLVESIAGALLIDTKLNLNEVWRIIEPLLSPIVTPDKLELPPTRELMEMCDLLGYLIKDTCSTKGDTVIVELHLQLKDELLVGTGSGSTRKVARGQAALRLLKELEKRGITKADQVQDNKDTEMDNEKDSNEDTKSAIFNSRRLADRKYVRDCSMKKECYANRQVPVVKSISMLKGGPRTSLFELCVKKQWPKPTFTPYLLKSKSAMEVGQGVDKKTVQNTFESRISLSIPGYGDVELMGDSRADKKSSLDSAALLMVYELQRLQMIKIG